MPAAADHYRFALARLAELNASSARVGSASPHTFRPELVLLGTQGPDPFYFRGLIPSFGLLSRGRPLALANYLHGADPLEYFPALTARALAAAPTIRASAVSFVYGLILHYVLDRALHPYVYFRTGFDASGDASGIFGVRHGFFETGMAEAGRSAADPYVSTSDETNPGRMFAAEKADLSVADAVFAAAFPDRFESGDYAASWRDMRAVLGLLWDPSGRKRSLFDALGLHNTRARSMMRPIRDPSLDGIDYLNQKKEAWQYPADGTPSDASVRELTAKAEKDAAQAESLLIEALEGGSVDWSGLFRSINHEGHRPGERMRICRSIY
ncbi:MAG: hypothetical protein WCT14_15475 [Treponemataceae bacterium]